MQDYDIKPPEKAICKRSFLLHGPYSPLEIPIYNMVQNDNHKDIIIDGSSVNCVLLDPDPQDKSDRFKTILYDINSYIDFRS